MVTVRPLTGAPVATSTTVATSGKAADVQTEAVLVTSVDWPAARRAICTARAVPVRKVSGLATVLVAPEESTRVTLTVVAAVAVAGQVTVDCTAFGVPNT